MEITPCEALQLIERAVVALQSRCPPGRPLFYQLNHVHREVRAAQHAAGRLEGPADASATR